MKSWHLVALVPAVLVACSLAVGGCKKKSDAGGSGAPPATEQQPGQPQPASATPSPASSEPATAQATPSTEGAPPSPTIVAAPIPSYERDPLAAFLYAVGDVPQACSLGKDDTSIQPEGCVTYLADSMQYATENIGFVTENETKQQQITAAFKGTYNQVFLTSDSPVLLGGLLGAWRNLDFADGKVVEKLRTLVQSEYRLVRERAQGALDNAPAAPPAPAEAPAAGDQPAAPPAPAEPAAPAPSGT